jgi:hypothetical protein
MGDATHLSHNYKPKMPAIFPDNVIYRISVQLGCGENRLIQQIHEAALEYALSLAADSTV